MASLSHLEVILEALAAVLHFCLWVQMATGSFFTQRVRNVEPSPEICDMGSGLCLFLNVLYAQELEYSFLCMYICQIDLQLWRIW